MYVINTIIKCGTWQPVKFQSVSRFWNEISFYGISELMLPTLIQRYDKKSFHFWSSSKTKYKQKFYMMSDATFYDRINTIYQFIKPFLNKIKQMSIFEEYGAFKGTWYTWTIFCHFYKTGNFDVFHVAFLKTKILLKESLLLKHHLGFFFSWEGVRGGGGGVGGGGAGVGMWGRWWLCVCVGGRGAGGGSLLQLRQSIHTLKFP